MAHLKLSDSDKEETDLWQAGVMQKEYPQLDHTTYLDHAGTTLYPQSAIRSFARDMTENLYGNPHSASPSSSLSTSVVHDVRKEVLKRFSAPSDQFDLIFVPNATAAIKLVAQAFQDQEEGFWYGYHKDAHTSLVGVRELAKNGHHCFRSDEEVKHWIESGVVHPGHLALFAYPAQSNMTGYRPPLTWGSQVRATLNLQNNRVYTLLDAASYLTTGHLNLNDQTLAPDFIALSFYKMFGFPDLGALIVRREAAPVLLSRKYFGGGTVEMVVAVGDSWHHNHQQQIHEALEDGTLPFHNILALKHAMRSHSLLYPNPVQVAHHAAVLSRYAYTALESFRHENGRRVVTIYKDPAGQYGDSQSQGPIISLNIHDRNGMLIGKTRVEALACACGFQLRTGSLCNPGGIATMFDFRPWEMRRNFSHGMRCGDDLDFLGGKPTGVVRISLGAMTTKGDIERFLDFIDYFFICKDDLEAVEVARNVEESPQSSVDSIQPIRGCMPLVVPHGDFKSPMEASAAYMPWHENWVVTNPNSNTEIYGHERQLRELIVDLQPLEGTMIISHCGEESSSESSARTLVLDLWDATLGQNYTDLYPQVAIPKDIDPTKPVSANTEAFFTSVLGIPATLSRRITNREVSELRQSKHVCVVRNCQRDCYTPENLLHHYDSHAQTFTKRKAPVIPQKPGTGRATHESSSIKSIIPWTSVDWTQTILNTKRSVQRKASKWKLDNKNR